MSHAYPAQLADFAYRQWRALESRESAPGGSHTALPERAALEALLSVAYQASLLQEEARPVKFRVLLAHPDALPPSDGPPYGLHRLRFTHPRPFDDHEVRRLSPAAKYHRALIGVQASGPTTFEIWGVLQSGPRWLQSARGGRLTPSPVPRHALVIRVSGPGRIAISLGDVTLAEIRGGHLLGRVMDVFESHTLRAKFARFRAGLLSDYESAMADDVVEGTFPPLDPNVAGDVTVQMVKRLVSTIRESHRGGTILFVPHDRVTTLLHEQRAIRLKYAFADEEPRRRYRSLIMAVLRELAVAGTEQSPRPTAVGWSTYQTSGRPGIVALDEAILELSQLLAALSDVDGAVVLTEYFDVLGFGGEIGGNLPEIGSVRQARDLEGTEYDLAPVDGVGTRHRSAYRLCAHEREALAIVASHDGGVQFVAWHDGATTTWEHVPQVGAEM